MYGNWLPCLNNPSSIYLASFGINAYAKKDAPGVYIDEKKCAPSDYVFDAAARIMVLHLMSAWI